MKNNQKKLKKLVRKFIIKNRDTNLKQKKFLH